MSGIWFNSDAQLLYQAFVPLTVAFLIWARRADLVRTLQELEELFPDPQDRRRSGSPLLIALGGVSFFIALIGAFPQLTVFSVWLLSVGIVYYLFGPFLLREVSAPLVFGLLAIPPPMSFALGIVRQFQLAGATMLGGGLGLLGVKTRVSAPLVTLQSSGHTTLISSSLSGVGVFLATFGITLAFLIVRRASLGKGVVVIILAGFVSCVSGFLRLIFLGLIAQVSNDAATLFERPLALVPALLTLLVNLVVVYGFSRKLLRRPTTPQEVIL